MPWGLSRKEVLILDYARRLCEEEAPPSFTVAVTSPLNVLRELFTVKGAGTLLRRGARISHHEGWDGVDLQRLRELLASSFGRPPAEEFFARAPRRVYLDDGYRGCVILSDAPLGAYLTKFAVSAEAQGEGIARDLWEAVVAETPVVFWRARRTNRITTGTRSSATASSGSRTGRSTGRASPHPGRSKALNRRPAHSPLPKKRLS